jgi:hypothetical protein
LNAPPIHSQRQSHSIAANWIRFLANGIGIGQLAGVAGVCDVIFERG